MCARRTQVLLCIVAPEFAAVGIQMLIVLEGCVGVGKTTVAQGLAKQRGSFALLEDFASNPFLNAFYADPVENALETEFSFLMLHFHQLKAAASREEIVSDFHLWKDLIYADLNLVDLRILGLFRELHTLLQKRLPSPSMMIFLSASSSLILQRIEQRGRPFESGADRAYFRRVNDAYQEAFKLYSGRKLLIPMDSWDFVRNPGLFSDLNALVNREMGI
jgi:deoxyguanosine kinase